MNPCSPHKQPCCSTTFAVTPDTLRETTLYPLVSYIHKQAGKTLWIHGLKHPPFAKSRLQELNFVSSKGKLVDDNQDYLPASHFRDRIQLFNIIKSCGREKNIWKVRRIHAIIIEKSLIVKDTYIATALITTYAKCGVMEKAREVFDQIQIRDVVTWNALIAGYVQNGFAVETLECFEHMKDARILPDAITYVCVLKACGMLGSLETGEVVEFEVRKQGLLKKDVVLGTALMDMYFKCGEIEKAREMFEQLPERDVVSWSALIAGYAQNGLGDEALECFRQMRFAGVCPNVVTSVSVLQACGIVGSLKVGEEIEAEVRKQGLLEKNVVLGTALVDMYSKCGALEKAREVFKRLQVRNVVSWSAIMTGYVEHGLGHEALECYREMQDARVSPDVVTYICVLKACGIVGSRKVGENIDIEIRKQGLLHKEHVLGNALVDMYSKCDAMDKAREVFELLPVRDVISWNALIAGYAQNGLGHEALKCVGQMRDTGVSLDTITYVCTLKACGILGFLEMGEVIDGEVRKQGLLEKNVMVGNALVDMYSKCGALEKAREMFEQIPVKDVVSWSALISGHAQLGHANLVLNLYRRMLSKGVMPNLVTFVVLLSACSHAGLVKEGEKIFEEMFVYHLTPTLEHYTCMVDLFGRVGRFDKVKGLLGKVSHPNHLPLFLSILGSCRKWRNVRFGRWAFEHSLLLDKKCAAAYVYMENIYAST